MKKMNPGQGVREGIHQLPPEDIETLVWNPAHVPGDVYTDLWKAGVIDDPYFGRNSAKAQWVMYDEWWYAYQFNMSEDLTDKVVRIDFDGVDYACDVWLNGTFLGRHEGAFSPFSFDVTEALRSSKKSLAGRNMLIVKLDPPPQVNARVAGKKTPWFGDYWRDLIPFGIWQPVKMVTTGQCRILEVYANPKINDDGSASVTLEMELENTTNAPRSMQVVASLQGENFESEKVWSEFDVELQPGTQIIKKTLKVEDAKLWWPWDLGDPNLYQAKVSLNEGDANHDVTEETFGIREVTMAWNPGFGPDEVSFPRTTLINGKTHFIRSACWGGPPDIFVGRTSVDEYRKLIQMAKDANMNNIRIFGWHPPEIREFYELCNEAGLTVWQDVVPLGTGNLPKDEAFLDGIIEEAVAVIKERRNHPCLIMIEGGEEMFLRSGDAMFTRNFLEKLGSTLQEYVDLPYVPDSPLTCATAQEAGYKPKEAVHALAYFYGMGRWLMEDWYSSLDFPIVPELAITSVPSVESLKKFIPAQEMWPPGLSWGYHWADLDRLRMQNWDTFGDEMTGSLEEFVNATQDSQGTIFQLSVEHFRRGKPRVSGIALCHYITYWPDMKWGIVDNYQEPKRSYEFVKRSYQPLLVSLQFDKRRWFNEESFAGELWIVNDLYEQYEDCSIEVLVKSDTGKVLSKDLFDVDSIAENSSEKMLDFAGPKLKRVEKRFYVEVALRNRSGEMLSENEYMLLIGDQEAASAEYKRWGQEVGQKRREHGSANYLRYYPDMIREDGTDLKSDTETPRASGF
ncbi:glycoside hydrolase family 2 protein [Pelagicoccus mobilis]|uniref:Beta-mannosidase B n=1 Tax=Pelagicoccus mobilis TaxID=415221 RepID=A0A934VSF5_9BACT|nr:sugar-binding domain-containing protein [Pelagicoccus mobilis]MBK1878960.1 glycoside hydrolase family 2 [Pelagicoccus mobilis]